MASPYKMKNSMLKMAAKGAPMQKNYAGPLRDEGELNDLVEKRTKLRKKEENLNDGKTKIFGNVRRKRNKNKQEKNQAEINANTTAQKNATKGTNKKKTDRDKPMNPNHPGAEFKGEVREAPTSVVTKETNGGKKKPQGRRQS